MSRRMRNRTPYQAPVQKIELTNKNIKLRLTAAVLFLIVAVTAFTYGIISFLKGEAGWREIEVYSSAGVTCGEDFVFLYEVGSQESISKEVRLVTTLYSNAAKTAYEIFNADVEIEGVANLWYINHHPNEEIVVDDALYNALSQVSEDGGRWIYLGPAYSIYDNLFYMSSSDGAVDFDPHLNPVIGKLFQEICRFAEDSEAVNLELMGNNTLKLIVSEEYLAFAETEELEDFIDLYWMKNAFIVDYLTDRLLVEGYTHGVITSYDGFVRCLDDRGTPFAYQLYHEHGGVASLLGTMEYTGPCSFVTFRSYPLSGQDYRHYLILSDGSIRTPYLSTVDGLDRCSIEEMTAYAYHTGCAEIALKAASGYIADEFQESALTSLTETGIYTVYWESGEIRNSDPLFSIEEEN